MAIQTANQTADRVHFIPMFRRPSGAPAAGAEGAGGPPFPSGHFRIAVAKGYLTLAMIPNPGHNRRYFAHPHGHYSAPPWSLFHPRSTVAISPMPEGRYLGHPHGRYFAHPPVVA